jgi:organic radical activating enzyme
MQFPASDKEKQLVYLSVYKLKEKLEAAAESAKDLEDLLLDNHLAINKEYKKLLLENMTELDSFAWRLSVQTARMNNRKERIISAP